jgi:iron complex outermembrane receptor protein
LKFTGSPEFDSEYLIAYEIGYRIRPWKVVGFDVTGYINDYDNLRTFVQGAPDFSAFPAYVIVPVLPGNQMHGRTYGTEFTVRYEPVSYWKLRASYTLLQMDLRTDPGSLDTSSASIEGNSPRHQFLVHSSLDLPGNVQFDAFFRWVDKLPTLGVEAYPSLDLRLAWSPKEHWQIALVGQNLLDDRHAEYGGISLGGAVSTEVPRSAYVKVSFTY